MFSFIESSLFTRLFTKYLSEAEYAAFSRRFRATPKLAKWSSVRVASGSAAGLPTGIWGGRQRAHEPSTRAESPPVQARRNDEMQAVADALSLLACIIMAWNTSQMQAVLDHWPRRHHLVPSELIGRIAPTRLEGIDPRGVFRFPVERYAAQLLPSQTAPKTRATP